MKVKIRAAHVTDTQAQAAARKAKGTLVFVEGIVDFMPVAGGYYTVTGELVNGRASVWIENFMTKLPVTKRVVQE